MNPQIYSKKPAPWQKQPDMLITPMIQYWHNGTMVTAQMTLATAKQKVLEGTAFVISVQAIGALDQYGNFAD